MRNRHNAFPNSAFAQFNDVNNHSLNAYFVSTKPPMVTGDIIINKCQNEDESRTIDSGGKVMAPVVKIESTPPIVFSSNYNQTDLKECVNIFENANVDPTGHFTKNCNDTDINTSDTVFRNH